MDQGTNRRVKRCLASLTITEMQIKGTESYQHPLHLLEWVLLERQGTKSVGKAVEKREPLCTAGGNVNENNHYENQYGVSFEN